MSPIRSNKRFVYNLIIPTITIPGTTMPAINLAAATIDGGWMD